MDANERANLVMDGIVPSAKERMQPDAVSAVSGGDGLVGEGVEEGGGLFVGGVFRAHNFDGQAFERGFAGEAFEPASMRELLVVGKIEADEEAEVAGAGRGFLVVFCAIGLAGCGAVETEFELAAEAEGLLQAVNAVTCLLGRVFVSTEIED